MIKDITISNFMEVEIWNGKEYQNIYQFLEGQKEMQLFPRQEGSSIIALDIRLVDMESKQDDKELRDWNERVDKVNQEKMEIESKIKIDEKKL